VIPNTDFPLNDWQAAGLNVRCGVKVRIATLEERLVVKVVGALSGNDRQLLDERLRTSLQL
jgi:hypothetical protein